MREFVKGLVSIITPIYNGEKFVAKTIDSVISQTYTDWELILVDDCSKDNSYEIIRAYCDNYPNIVYQLQEKNMGAAVARNTALEMAKGQFVAFLDCDDLWVEDKTERQLALMQENQTPFCYAAIDMMNEEGVTIKPKRKIKETCTYKYLLKNTIIATSSVIIDRSKLGDFRMPLRRGGQDYATWLMLLRNGVVARGINKTLVHYRVVKNSLSANKFKSVKQVWEIQTQNEKINKVRAVFNIVCFAWHALIKHLF